MLGIEHQTSELLQLTRNSNETSLPGAPNTPSNRATSSNLNDKVNALPSIQPPRFLIPIFNLGVIDGCNGIRRVGQGSQNLDSSLKLGRGRRGQDDFCTGEQGNLASAPVDCASCATRTDRVTYLSSTKRNTTCTKTKNSLSCLYSRLMGAKTRPSR